MDSRAIQCNACTPENCLISGNSAQLKNQQLLRQPVFMERIVENHTRTVLP